MKHANMLFFYEKDMRRGELQTPAGEILQVAELAIVQESEIRAHFQVCDEITYAISGRATVFSGENVFRMTAGQIHYVQKGAYHRIVADTGENFRYCCIGFLPKPDYREISCFLEAIRYRKDFLIADEGNIGKLFPLLIDEFHIPDAESNAMIHFYFCQMLIQLYRILTGKSREKLSRLNTSASNLAVYRALKYIDREYMSITQIREVAQALSYSEYYLSHIFKEKMDITVKEYLMQKKLMTAANLLENSSMSVSDIAEQLHFSSLHAFGLAFKRYMSMSPSQYRSQSREKI